MDYSDSPYAVCEITATGRVLRVFADEYLAMQFAVNNGSQVVRNPAAEFWV